ncbi:MAG: GTPase ObgE [Acidimicrobiales bacterium]
MASPFVDESQVHVKGGNGGAGAVSFRREAHVSRGGPDGGDGGQGGSVYLEATTNLASLLSFVDHPHRRAGDGGHGGGKKRHGRNGADLVVPVPVGTIVHHQNGDVLADLTSSGDRYLAAAGGRGGRGNARFLSNRLRAPAFAEQAELGEEHWLNLELELMADVALVGFPNAGKSTLVSTISSAKPKIADYPFTTLEPHLGVVRVGGTNLRDSDAVEFVVADIPGLIEGASEGRGLGHKFLRHVERARVLLVLADLGEDEGRAPSEQVRVLLDELGLHRPELLERPRMIVGSRADRRPVDPSGTGAFAQAGGDRGALRLDLEISAVTGAGLPQLLGRLAALVEEARAEMPLPRQAAVVHRPEPEGVTVRREGSVFVVAGKEAARAVAVSDLTNPDALEHVHRRLKRIGVDRALARAGAHDGDVVRIGELNFTYESER